MGGGSSPHTRGAQAGTDTTSESWRIIPAYAGSTGHVEGAFHFWPDHPRIRGEHIFVRVARLILEGSSPHTRGARRRQNRYAPPRRNRPAYGGSPGPPIPARPAGGGGIIPAYAGSTIVEEETGRKPIGSSPHTRGARRRLHRLRPRYRIIPAYAGSTVPVGYVVQDRGDHPRIRGEHPSSTTSWTTSGRIIPAYAGSTPGGRLPFRGVADHPRIRGEHVLLGGSH